MKGSVTVSLDDFKRMEEEIEKSKSYKELLTQLDGALTRLLVHTSTVTDMNLISKGFNRAGKEQITKTPQGWRMLAE